MSVEILERQLSQLGQCRTRGRRPARVVVIGNVGNGNTGDEALLAATLRFLGTDPQVTVLSRQPERISALHGVAAVPMTATGAGPALAGCDAVVVVGGGMFGPGLPPLVRLLPHLVTAAALTGRDTAYVGIGVYPGMPPTTLSALQYSATRGRGVTVRDNQSAHLLNPAHPPPCVGDLALHLPAAATDEALRELHAAQVDLARPLLILAPKAAATPEKTRNLLLASVHAARHWGAHGGSIAALILSDRTDHGIAAGATDSALASRIGHEASLSIPHLGPNLRPSLAKAITGEASAVFGLRFHSLVFATGTSTPAISFAWEPKTAAFMAEHGIPNLVEPFNPHQLTDWLDGCLSGPSVAAPAAR